MGWTSDMRILERRLRSSKEYDGWISRNKASRCFGCDSEEGLQVHHLVELRHVFRGLWRLYGDLEASYEHILAMHADDRCEGVTLCDSCHRRLHPGRRAAHLSGRPIRVDLWSVAPRSLDLPFSCSKKGDLSASVGLVGFQSLLGFGWYLLGGHMDPADRMLVLDRRRFAELLGKTPGSSFNHGLEDGLSQLVSAGPLLGFGVSGNQVELHLAPSYLSAVSENPWFFPMRDVHTHRMLTILLRWRLSHKGAAKTCRFNGRKLAETLGVSAYSPGWFEKAVSASCEETPWASVEWKDHVATFSLSARGAVPIHSLRAVLSDSLGT